MSNILVELKRNSIYAVGNKITIIDKEEFDEVKKYELGDGLHLKVDFSHLKTHKRFHFERDAEGRDKEILWLALPVEPDKMPEVSSEVKIVDFATMGINDYMREFKGIDLLINEKGISLGRIDSGNITYAVYKEAYDKACKKECPDIELKLTELIDYLKMKI